jgi:outer membrane protein assembly factor BamA
VDLVLNVQEKAVGTASAGAGFSSQGGLTGFVELGHPNLFGNGQAVNLRLEKGSKTSNFEFSFTEPWFLDSPTTLGADIFRNTLIRDIYEVKRTGGALRVSRPIPGVPYARAFTSYSFENTDGLGRITFNEEPIITHPDSTTDVVKQAIYTPDPVQIDPSSRNTSSITFGLSRNSTDHPTYPHTGMSTIFTNEFAGGILQGNVSFQKHVLDNRIYFKGINFPKVTKPAFMFRTQLGGIGFFGREDPLRVPLPDDSTSIGKGPDDRLFTTEALELFRLGGTQGQALRGYSDYEVVPEENVRRRTTIVTTTTTKNGIPESDTTTAVVYDTFPGGRYYGIFSLERQFLIAEPLHGVLFGEAGGTWNDIKDISFRTLHKSLGFGVRMEIPLLGQVGFDYAYGFDRLNRSADPAIGGRYNRGGWQGHLHFGRFF